MKSARTMAMSKTVVWINAMSLHPSKDSANPTHIQSVKSVSSHSLPFPNTSGSSKFRKATRLDEGAQSQSLSQGEGVVSPEHLAYNDDLLAGLKELRARVENEIEDPGIRKKALDSLTKANNAVSHEIERGQLKTGKMQKNKVSTSNIISGNRKRLRLFFRRMLNTLTFLLKSLLR